MRRILIAAVVPAMFATTFATAETKLLKGSFENAVTTYVMVKLCRDRIFIKPSTLSALDDEFTSVEGSSSMTKDQKETLKRDAVAYASSIMNRQSFAIFTPDQYCAIAQRQVEEFEVGVAADSVFPGLPSNEKSSKTAEDRMESEEKTNSHSMAVRLPVRDGAYLAIDGQCGQSPDQASSAAEYKVEGNGTIYTTAEGRCDVTDVQRWSDPNYSVSGKCHSAGRVWDHQYSIRTLSNDSLQINDGPILRLCVGAPVPELKERSTDSLFALWLDSEEQCRGGSPEDSRTDEACAMRSIAAAELQERNWCFGKLDQSRSQYDWHHCEANSLRQ